MEGLDLFGQPTGVHRWADLSGCGTFRWALGRSWSDGPRIAWLMLNPSRADADRDDPTLLRVTSFSRRWGYGSLVVINQHAYRSPNPEVLAAWLARGAGVARAAVLNAARVAREVEGCRAVVAAWGAGGDCAAGAALLEGRPALCLGTTASGAPKHPLARGRARVPDDFVPIPWAGPAPRASRAAPQ